MVTEHLDRLRYVLVVCRHRPGFTTRPEILSRVEAEARRHSERTSSAPDAIGRSILRAMCLAGIFDDQQAEARGDRRNRVHVGHLPVDVNGNDGFEGLPRAFPKWAPSLRIAGAALEVLSECLRTHAVRHRID